MGEIKNRLNIKKITVKNLFLLILMMAAMAVIGVITKSIGSGRNIVNINTAQAQSCWTPPGVTPVVPPPAEGGGGEGSVGGDCTADSSSCEGVGSY